MSVLERTRKARIAVLLVALVGVAIYGGWRRLGPILGDTPWQGRLDLAHGVVVERVTHVVPPWSLIVARVPRGAGLRLRAALLDPAQQSLLPIGHAAAPAGALVAINGDFHREQGFCFATPFSTFVDGGEAPVIGSPFSYACAFWLDREGAPHIGVPDVGAALRLPSGARLPVYVNLETGNDLLITRPPGGVWDTRDVKGVPLERVDATTFRVAGPPGARFEGPALLRRGGFDDAPGGELTPGATLVLERTGADAARVLMSIGTGPRLVEGGRVAAALDDPADAGWDVLYPRTAVGLTPTHVVLVASYQVAGHELTLKALARAMISLGCTEATNLDGGPSTALWADGRLRNAGSDPELPSDVPVACALLVLPPDPAGPDPGVR